MEIKNKSIYYEKNKLKKEVDKNFKIEQAKRRRRNIIYILIIFIVLSILNNQSVSIINFFQTRIKINGLKHIIIVIFSFLTCFGISLIDYKIYKKKSIKITIAILSVIILTFMIFGKNTNLVVQNKGAAAWLNLRFFTIQPSEILKIPFIILIASIFAKAEENNAAIKSTIIFSSGIFAIFAFLICKENDLGTVLHYTAIYLFMLFLTNIPKKIINLFFVLFTPIVLGIFYIIFKYGDEISKDYKILRIQAFLQGLIYNNYENKLSYQVKQSLLAFGNGGFLGQSYGNGIQKYSYLPEIHTDFIIALFGEEMGFIGMIWLIGCFFMLYTVITAIGRNCNDKFGKYLALGIAGYIISQFLINIFVTLGLLPVFGIPMPIFSYGGSSIITIFIGVGIVLNIDRKLRVDK